MELNIYITKKGEKILYTGSPNFEMLDELAEGPGSCWHSSLDQGFKNCFEDLVFQTAVYWWFLNDFESVDKSVNWRINIKAFAIRASVWEQIGGLDYTYDNWLMEGVDLGYNLLRNFFAIPMYIKGLYPSLSDNKINFSKKDIYKFYFRNFKNHHAFYMLLRKGIFKISEINAYLKSKNTVKRKDIIIPSRKLNPIIGKPTVSLVIPTMKRQEYAQILLEDHKNQTYLIKEAIIVDATPEEERDNIYYQQKDFPFEIKVKWQTSKGSCRARNEALDMCTGDYIIFADDDIRILPDFVENHIRLLQTYQAKASNGLDIMAQNVSQNLEDLNKRLIEIENSRWKVGVSPMFSNANSCVHKSIIEVLKGNDINFDGGYGEDSDFGLSILKIGEVLLHNPYSPNLHLKPPQGGYRWWGSEAMKKGKKRKIQPWELNNPVKYIRPVPSPTITYGILKHFTKSQILEWRYKHFFMYLFKRDLKTLLVRLLIFPYKQLQFSKSLQYAKALINIGIRYY